MLDHAVQLFVGSLIETLVLNSHVAINEISEFQIDLNKIPSKLAIDNNTS